MSAADALPEFHHRERHAIGVVATPERALRAAREVTLGELALVRALFRLRGLGSGRTDTPLWDLIGGSGFREIGEGTYVLVGRPWLRRGGTRPDVTDFAGFAEPGYAKMAFDLRALSEPGGTRLETETRVFLTDASARRRFAAYWLAVRPFSGLIRRLWLRAAKRRAESR